MDTEREGDKVTRARAWRFTPLDPLVDTESPIKGRGVPIYSKRFTPLDPLVDTERMESQGAPTRPECFTPLDPLVDTESPQGPT